MLVLLLEGSREGSSSRVVGQIALGVRRCIRLLLPLVGRERRGRGRGAVGPTRPLLPVLAR